MHLVARSAKSLLVMALLAGLAADGLAQGRRHREALLQFDVPAPSPKPPAKPEAESGGP